MALVFAQFGEPHVAPVLGALGFPENAPVGLTGRVTYGLHRIPPALPLRHTLEAVSREGPLEHVDQVDLEDLASELLRTRVAPPTQLLDRLLHRPHLRFPLRELQPMLLVALP